MLKAFKIILNAVNLIKFAADCFQRKHLAATIVTTFFQYSYHYTLCVVFPINVCDKRNKQLRNTILDSSLWSSQNTQNLCSEMILCLQL